MHFTTAIFFVAVASFFGDASSIPVQTSQLNTADGTSKGPEFTFPTFNDFFLAGETTQVVWNVSQVDPGSQSLGKILLGQQTSNNSGSTTPLAKDFLLTDGRVGVVMPADSISANNYVVTLIDESGQLSPSVSERFRIEQPE